MRGLGWAGLRWTLLFFLLGEAGAWWWVFDLFSHFRLQYLAAGLVLVGVGCLARSWRLVLAAGAFTGILGGTLVPYLPRPGGGEAAGGLGLLSFNVHSDNVRHGEVLDLIRRQEPEIVILYEVNEDWMRAMGRLGGEYEPCGARPREGNFGIGVWARAGMGVEAEIVEIGEAGVPSVVMRLDLPEFCGVLIGTHPVPPLRAEMARHRDGQLEGVAALAARLGVERCVVAGDFNASPWSAAMRPLGRLGLRDARLGHGISGTWRRDIPPLTVPIDSVWVGAEVEVREVRVLPSCGSDHNGIFVRVGAVE